MKLKKKIIIIAALAVLLLAVCFIIQGLLVKDPDLKQDSVYSGAENTAADIEDSSTAVDIVKSEKLIDNVISEAVITNVTPESIMDRIKSRKATGRTRKTPATLQIIENGQTLSEVVHRIGDPKGLFEIKHTDTIFLYYPGDLKIELIKGKVVNLPSDFNEKLKQAFPGKEQEVAVQIGTWNKIKKRGRLMQGKIKSLLRKFKALCLNQRRRLSHDN